MSNEEALTVLALAESKIDERTTLACLDVLDRSALIPIEPWVITMLCRALRERLRRPQFLEPAP